MDRAEIRMSHVITRTLTRRTVLIAAGAATATVTRAEELLGGRVMYMVRRTYATDKDIAALRTPAEPEHQKHLLKFSDTVVSSAIIENGIRIGSISISDSGGRAEIERYVYDDPFTKAGIFASSSMVRLLKGQWNPQVGESA